MAVHAVHPQPLHVLRVGKPDRLDGTVSLWRRGTVVSPRARPGIVRDDGVGLGVLGGPSLLRGSALVRRKVRPRQKATATNAGIVAHCLRLVIYAIRPYRLEEDRDVVNFFTKSLGARYDARKRSIVRKTSSAHRSQQRRSRARRARRGYARDRTVRMTCSAFPCLEEIDRGQRPLARPRTAARTAQRVAGGASCCGGARIRVASPGRDVQLVERDHDRLRQIRAMSARRRDRADDARPGPGRVW